MELITQSFRFELRIAAVVGVLLALFLLAMRPEDRASTRNALLLVLLCTIAELFSSLYADDASSRVARIASFAAGFGMGIALIRLASILVFRLLFPAMRFKVVNLVEDLVFAALLLVWGFAWLSIVGVDLASLVTTSAVITGVIAFSMQDTLGNILGGIVLQLEQSVKVKDWVQIDDIRGQVTDVRWRYTEIVTRNHETVYVPNSYLMKNRFMVMGARADPGMRWRRWVWFNLDFSLPPLEVCEILVRSIRDAEIDRVAHDPAPTAVLMDVTEGCARYALRYFLNDARSDDPTDSIVRAHALAALERAGVRLAVRREERTVLREDEERAAAKAKVEHEQRVRALASLPMFAPLSDEEKSEVADHLIHAPFVKGDVVTRQGAVAHWLYLVISGEAEVIDETEGQRQHVSFIKAGKVFGERGMLTGEPRGATVVAHTDLRCYRLNKEGFEGVMKRRPDIAEAMSAILSRRDAELHALRTARQGQRKPEEDRIDLLARMRTFFALD